MSSTEILLFVLSTILATSTPQPLIHRSTYKGLNGIAPSAEIFSTGLNRAVYYHEQAIAVVDINKNNEINNCDIVEAYEHREIQEILKNLSVSVRPVEVSFEQMTVLMLRCEQLDRMQRSELRGKLMPKGTLAKASTFRTNALNLLSGILPGTKWCGTGDVAQNYHDLGPEADIDSCCRTHDLCPIKIRGQSTRYNLTNYSLYSKSHCTCDNALFHCLKSVTSPAARIIGKLFFNIVRVECVDDVPGGSSKKFTTSGLTF